MKKFYNYHNRITSPNKKYMLRFATGYATLDSFLNQRHIFLKRYLKGKLSLR